MSPARSVNDRHRHQISDAAPVLPAVETDQIVGSHDPDEANAQHVLPEITQGAEGIAGRKPLLEACDDDAGIVAGEVAAGGDALLQWGQTIVLFQRIAGCHHPPQTIELQSAQRCLGTGEMAFVRWIERAAHQPDALAGKGEWGMDAAIG